MTGAALFIAGHLLALLLLTATAWVAGLLLLRRSDGEDAWERFGLATALGLAVLGHLGLLLGFFGVLSRGPVIAVLVGVHLLGLGAWWRGPSPPWPPSPVTGRGGKPEGEGRGRPSPGDGRGDGGEGLGRGARRRLAVLGLLAVLAPFFLLSLYPPTAFDETLYHLPYAREFIRAGGVPFLPALRNPVFPQLSELIFAEMMMLAGDVAVHQVELLATMAVAALLAGWGRRAFSPAAGWLAAGIWLGNPIVAHLAGTAYVEPGLALFAAAAIYAGERWRETEEKKWLVLAAVFAGSAAGTKYLGLFIVGVLFLWVALSSPRERRWRDLGLYSVVTLAVLAPWYGRILFYTGNPLFPFFPDLLGTGPSDWDIGGALPRRSLSERLVAFLRIPWDVVFDRGRIGYQPPYSPVYLLGLPLLLAAAFRDSRVRLLLAIGVVYAMIFVVLPPDSRYLVAVLPLLTLALGGAASRWASAQLAAALAVVLLLPGWLYAGYRVVRQGPVPVTAEERDAYLARELPLYPAVRFLNRTRGSDYTVYAFHAENMVYHADGVFLGDWSGPARFARFVPLVNDPEALYRELRHVGADHLLIVEGRGVALPVDDAAFRKRFRRVYSDGASEVYELAEP
ncbi:MAG TPA: glycosyltransferase family 39 protein [Thermoanaerobaculia bacterium]